MPEDDRSPENRERARELIERHDGADRVALLPLAWLVTVSPSADTAHPVFVDIVWQPGQRQQPVPGSALWRAALQRRLAELKDPDPLERVLRNQIERSVERFPDLESWWRWLRTGWLAPW